MSSYLETIQNLKANEAFRGLQAQLEGTENRIKVSRNDFQRLPLLITILKRVLSR
jgi:hypothetical protein